MINREHTSPGRETRKSDPEWTSSHRDAQVDESREFRQVQMGDGTCSPSLSDATVQYDGESLDFGDAGGSLI
jgi:hypothetical protein